MNKRKQVNKFSSVEEGGKYGDGRNGVTRMCEANLIIGKTMLFSVKYLDAYLNDVALVEKTEHSHCVRTVCARKNFLLKGCYRIPTSAVAARKANMCAVQFHGMSGSTIPYH